MKRQRIDLDSESVLDYDINTALYTPLPEPKIMQVVRTKKNKKEGETVSGTGTFTYTRNQLSPFSQLSSQHRQWQLVCCYFNACS